LQQAGLVLFASHFFDGLRPAGGGDLELVHASGAECFVSSHWGRVRLLSQFRSNSRKCNESAGEPLCFVNQFCGERVSGILWAKTLSVYFKNGFLSNLLGYHSVHSLLSSRLLSGNVKVKIYKTIILPVVLYGCETWSVTLTEEHRLRVFENRVLRGIFGPKRDEVMGEWRKLHNGELHNLYS
jgi:hypothetical protein